MHLLWVYYKAFQIINGRYINRHLDTMLEFYIYKVRYRHKRNERNEWKAEETKKKNPLLIHPFYHIKVILYYFRKNLGITNFSYIFLSFYNLYVICVAFLMCVKGHSPLAGSISICLSREDFKILKNSYNFIPCPIDSIYSTSAYLYYTWDAMKFLFILI